MPIARATLVLMLGNVASRLLGLVREQVIAAIFGASAATDAFTAASRIPTTVYDLLVGGMIAAALVPVFSDYLEDNHELSRLASATVNLAIPILLAATALLAAAAPWLTVVYAAGFPAETQALATDMVRLMLPAIVFMGLSGIVSGLLYSRQRFTLPAFAVAAYNAGLIVVAVACYQGLGVLSLVAGVLAGAVLQAALQLPGLRACGFSWTATWSHPGLRRALALYLPVVLGLVVSAVGTAIDSNLASRTGEGNMAAMRFATTLVQFPLGLIAAAASLALLPTLSRQAASVEQGSSLGATVSEVALADDANRAVERPLGARLWEITTGGSGWDAYKRTLFLGMRAMLLAILPAAAGLVSIRQPLVRLLFQRGAFDAVARERTALAFLCYSPGLPAAALDQLLIFAFYARKNTVTPVVVGALAVGIYLIVGLALIGPLGMPGLALANSAQWLFHAVAMLILLHRALGGLEGSGLGATFVKAIAASGVMAMLLMATESWAGEATSSLAGYVVAACIGGGFIYGGLLWLLRVPELKLVVQAARRRG